MGSKNKLKKFNENLNFQNLFQPNRDDILNSNFKFKGRWNDYFENSNPITLELGCGKGEYSFELAKKYLNRKKFPYGKRINFNSVRKGKIIGEHEVLFSSGKEIIRLNHEAFDRALYSEGALTAASWLMRKKPGLYSMRDLMNFK